MQNLIHPLATLIACVFGLYPALAVAIFFLGREIAQAEYRWIEQFGKGLRANMPWYAILQAKAWNFHSWFWNLTLPFIIVLLFWMLT